MRVTVTAVLENRVAAGSDDAEESAAGAIDLASSDLELVQETTGLQRVGLRFTGITIPVGAIISNAWVQFVTDEVQSVATTLTIRGHAIANAPTFSSTAKVSTRPPTTAFATWSPAGWTTIGQSGLVQRTTDLTDVIQEIVSLPGWANNNALALLITGTGHRTARAFEQGAANGALLHIEYGTVPPPNAAPVVDAGPSGTITLPFGFALNGTVTDDGRPAPPGTVTTQWVKASGPGTVTFGNPNAIDTQATFTLDGTYVLRLTANDGEYAPADSVVITVNPVPPNVPPVVDAGPNRTVTMPFAASLDGTASDDGLPNPPQTFSTLWSKGSGPGTVTFGNANAIDTQASFSLDGTYILRLTGNDTEATTYDSMTVIVNPAPPNSPPVVDAGPDRTVVLPATAALDGTVTDDGQPIPPGAVTQQWTKGSGPGTVTFVNANAIDTQASFGSVGVYLLRLTANDGGGATVYDSMRVTVAAVLEKRIAAGADDAEESATGTLDLASSDLELVQETSGLQRVGLRFTAIPIPAGATIVNAWVQFVADEVQSVATSLTIRGQAITNAPAFTTTNKISTRTGTTTSVVWSPVAWTTIGQAGPNQRTPDLTAVIQEIVSTPGWAANNALVLLINGTGHRTAHAFEQGAANSALLHIEYR